MALPFFILYPRPGPGSGSRAFACNSVKRSVYLNEWSSRAASLSVGDSFPSFAALAFSGVFSGAEQLQKNRKGKASFAPSKKLGERYF